MAMFNPRSRHRTDEAHGVGPQLSFAAATFAGFTAWAGAVHTLPPDYAMPIVATLMLVLAAYFSLVAWRRRGDDPNNVTYWDVAGALTLIGLFVAATIDPDQLVRIVQSGPAED